MGIEFLSDESILRFYEDIRQQVAADLATGNRYRFAGEAARQQAERLRMDVVLLRHCADHVVRLAAGPLCHVYLAVNAERSRPSRGAVHPLTRKI